MCVCAPFVGETKAEHMDRKPGPNSWPFPIRHTDKFPKFYFDKLEKGTHEESRRAAMELFNAHFNNTSAREMKHYDGGRGMDIMATWQKQAQARFEGGEKLDMNPAGLMANVLHVFGHPDYNNGTIMQNSVQHNYFGTRGDDKPIGEDAAALVGH